MPDYDKYRVGCPNVSPPQINFNGRISRVGPDGTRATAADNLPVVVSTCNDLIGPNSLAFHDLSVNVAAGETQGLPDYQSGVYRVTNGKIALVTSLEAFQQASPPAWLAPTPTLVPPTRPNPGVGAADSAGGVG